MALAFTLLASACASTTWRSAREDASDAPLHVRAELELIAGDAEVAAGLAEKALAQGGDPEARAFFALVVASDALGTFERPLPFFARALDQAKDPAIAARIAVEASRAWARLDGQDAASPDVRAALERLAQRPGPAWEEARAYARRELIAAERLRDGPLAAREAATAAGYLLDWKLSAPWGDAPMLDFTSALGPETRPLEAEELSGAGWDLIAVPTARQIFADGEVTFFEMPASGAVGFAEADLAQVIDPGAARRAVLRLESNRLATVLVDGHEVLSRRSASDPWLAVAKVDLPAGPHRATVKLATADGRGFFRLQVSELGPAAVDRLAVVPAAAPRAASRLRPGDGRAAVLALLDLEERLSRPAWDPDGARERAAALEASFGPHTSLDLLLARLELGDLAAPGTERRQLARARYRAVLARSPAHPVARRGLARIERDEERPDRALSFLLASDAAQPIDVRTRLDLLDLYRARGWEAEALATAEALLPVAPASPRLMQELIDLYKAFGRVAPAEELAAALEARYRGAGVERLQQLRADFGADSPAEIYRLFDWEPQRHTALRQAVAGLRRGGQLDLAKKMVETFLATHPSDGWALGERSRIALQAGKDEDALALIEAALKAQPDFAPLESLGFLLVGKPERLDKLEDGPSRLFEYRQFTKTPAGAPWTAYPIVNLLEHTRVAVLRDGSTLELTHRVRLAQTKQGADELGDLRPPEGVRLLVVRTLKADGRVLEPERTAGKAELSFPELQPGDAVETAWVSRGRVARGEGGYLTGVSFAAWGAPIYDFFADLQAVPGIELVAKPFGGAPAPQDMSLPGQFNILQWRLRKLAPIAKEPLSVSARSFFPFADVRAVNESLPEEARDADAWLRIARSYHSRLLHLGQAGWRTRELAGRFRAAKDPAGAAFEWLKSEVTDQEQLNNFETPVEAAIANKKGNRALLLWALLDALGFESDIVLCAPERDGPPEDREAPTPNPNRFFYPIVAARPRPSAPPVYYDPARPYTPAGDLPAELGGATCLAPLSSIDAAVFLALPPASDTPTFEAELALTLDRDGHARGTLSGLARGASASPLRQAFLAQDEERQRVFFEQWLASLAVGARLIDLTIEGAATSDAPMRWKLEIELRDYATRDGDALVVQRPLKTLVHADFAGVSELAQLVSTPSRVTPLRLLPFSEVVRLTLRAPGMRLVAPPPDVEVRGLSQKSALTGDTLTLTRRVIIRPGRVNPSEYDAFRADIAAVIRDLEGALRFAPGL